MKIVRHNVQVSEQDIIDELDKISARLPRLIGKAKENPLNVPMAAVFNLQLRAISDAVYLKRPKNHTYEQLFYALQFGVNHLKLASHPGKNVELKVGDLHVSAVGFESRDYTDASTWGVLFYIASILRDQQSLMFLSDIPTDFMKNSNVTFDDVEFAVVGILRSMKKRSELPNAISKYKSVLASAKYETMLRANFDHYLTTPMVNVIEKLDTDNKALFNHELKLALENHHEFYREEREEYGKPNDRFGWVSLKLLTACAYAYDQGVSIELESDYLPKWLIEGDFRDCKLTLS